MCHSIWEGEGAHPDAAHAVGEVGVHGEGVRLAGRFGRRLLGQDLVLAAGQRVQDADQVLLGQVGALPDLAECQLVLCTIATGCQDWDKVSDSLQTSERRVRPRSFCNRLVQSQNMQDASPLPAQQSR